MVDRERKTTAEYSQEDLSNEGSPWGSVSGQHEKREYVTCI
jgi:hypothetical protein